MILLDHPGPITGQVLRQAGPPPSGFLARVHTGYSAHFTGHMTKKQRRPCRAQHGVCSELGSVDTSWMREGTVSCSSRTSASLSPRPVPPAQPFLFNAESIPRTPWLPEQMTRGHLWMDASERELINFPPIHPLPVEGLRNSPSPPLSSLPNTGSKPHL